MDEYRMMSAEQRRTMLKFLRAKTPSLCRVGKRNSVLLQKLFGGPSLDGIEHLCPDGVPLDAIVFYHTHSFFRVGTRAEAAPFVELNWKDVLNLDDSTVENARNASRRYLKSQGKESLDVVPIGHGSTTPGHACQDSRSASDGPSLLSQFGPSRGDEVATSASEYIDPEGHCVSGAVLNLLYDHLQIRKKLARVFYDNAKKMMLIKEVGPWLKTASSETHKVEFHYKDLCKTLNNNLEYFQNHVTGTGDKYLVRLRLKSGAGHAISLDFGKDCMYDAEGRAYHCVKIQDGLRMLQESGATVEYAGEIVVVKCRKNPRSSKKRPRAEQ